tara:strand:- start:945 stop:1385 length:441 start_codon:yes stop_codon:yes gene_type:complete
MRVRKTRKKLRKRKNSRSRIKSRKNLYKFLGGTQENIDYTPTVVVDDNTTSFLNNNPTVILDNDRTGTTLKELSTNNINSEDDSDYEEDQFIFPVIIERPAGLIHTLVINADGTRHYVTEEYRVPESRLTRLLNRFRQLTRNRRHS